MDREQILDRYEAPLRRGALSSPPAVTASGTNPRCGDVVTMYGLVEGGALSRVSFEGSGCTISQAAADITAELAEGRSLDAVRRLQPADVVAQLGGTARLDCASLALHTLQQALSGASASRSEPASGGHDIVHVHVRIDGRVQGVGFRYTTAEEAERRRLNGWVRNLSSGGVEAVFEGPRSAVEDMLRWCRRGPPGSFVRDLHVDWDEAIEHFTRFEVRRTTER